MTKRFQLVSEYAPAGDQPKAIEKIVEGFRSGKRYECLLGATGTGKTFTAANVIAELNKPTLVLAHNKTLAAQLYKEFKGFFPHNAVNYFVSYYDYYQPEAYIPQRDIYIEKDSSINENIDRLRLSATSALVSREDVIIVASVSCIYGLGSPSDYRRMMVHVTKGEVVDRDNILLKLVDIQYQRNDIAFERGRFRVRGDTIEIWPASEEYALRMELFGDEVDRLATINPISGDTIQELDELFVYPAKHFVTPEDRTRGAIEGIEQELQQRLEQFKTEGKLLELERLKARCRYDLDMLREVGYCSGIENYARWFSGRNPGDPPYTLIDFFPEDFLCIVDESHATLPQVRGMHAGDTARKQTLVEHGFRLPSAMDNRPLRFEEWEGRLKQVLMLSATVNAPGAAWFWTALLGSGLLALYVLARAGSLVFWNTQPATDIAAPLSWPSAAGIAVLVVASLAWMVLAVPATHYATATARQLAQPRLYIDAVLGTTPVPPPGKER